MNYGCMIEERLAALSKLKDCGEFIERLGREITGAGKILVMGNGGSAAQASHLAAELMVRYKKERQRFNAFALGCDAAVVSAISNDYGYDEVFSLQIDTVAEKGDLAIAFSTSGNSQNIVRALQTAQRSGVRTVALLGKGGGVAKDSADLSYVVPSDDTAIVQEIHLALIHLVCEYLDGQS